MNKAVRSIYDWMRKNRVFDIIPDEPYLKLIYRSKCGKRLNLKHPQSFNEKLQWLKLNDRNPLYTRLADKYAVKQFVADAVGQEYVVPNLWVGSSIEEIPWDTLPEKFVIKANHDSSGAIICRDKNSIDIAQIQKAYRPIMQKNYFYNMREWPYKNIKPCILVDTYLDDNTSDSEEFSLRDYKFWCFNGEPKYMYCTVKGTEIYENFYDMDFHPVAIDHGFPRHCPEFVKPDNFEKMKELAGTLAQKAGAPFIRVDLFNVAGRIYFGEFTFYDWAGTRPFASYAQDMELGALIHLEKKSS